MNDRRGYQGKGGGGRPRQDAPPPRKTLDILPNPELLESYNYVVEGSARQLLEMFEREQRHRHEWEKRALGIHMFSTILGQVLGFIIAVGIFVSASLIGIYGDKTTAGMIWFLGMALVVMAGLVWAYAKSMGQRPLFGRPAMRTHFRPEKEESGRPPERS